MMTFGKNHKAAIAADQKTGINAFLTSKRNLFIAGSLVTGLALVALTSQLRQQDSDLQKAQDAIIAMTPDNAPRVKKLVINEAERLMDEEQMGSAISLITRFQEKATPILEGLTAEEVIQLQPEIAKGLEKRIGKDDMLIIAETATVFSLTPDQTAVFKPEALKEIEGMIGAGDPDALVLMHAFYFTPEEVKPAVIRGIQKLVDRGDIDTVLIIGAHYPLTPADLLPFDSAAAAQVNRLAGEGFVVGDNAINSLHAADWSYLLTPETRASLKPEIMVGIEQLVQKGYIINIGVVASAFSLSERDLAGFKPMLLDGIETAVASGKIEYAYTAVDLLPLSKADMREAVIKGIQALMQGGNSEAADRARSMFGLTPTEIPQAL